MIVSEVLATLHPRVLILDFHVSPALDVTALDTLAGLHTECSYSGAAMWVCGLQPRDAAKVADLFRVSAVVAEPVRASSQPDQASRSDTGDTPALVAIDDIVLAKDAEAGSGEASVVPLERVHTHQFVDDAITDALPALQVRGGGPAPPVLTAELLLLIPTGCRLWLPAVPPAARAERAGSKRKPCCGVPPKRRARNPRE